MIENYQQFLPETNSEPYCWQMGLLAAKMLPKKGEGRGRVDEFEVGAIHLKKTFVQSLLAKPA